MKRSAVAVGALAVASLLVSSCASVAPREQATTQSPREHPAAESPSEDPNTAESPRDRPVIDLAYRMEDDLTGAAGTAWIEFTPDREVCEVVLRAWPNKPATAAEGNEMTIDAVRAGNVELALTVEQAGAPAGSPGTLVEAVLPDCVDAGSTVAVEAQFTLVLGADTDERVGYSSRDEYAWLASAFPMLAFQYGVGWVEDDAVPVVGEMATSETFHLRDLSITAPSRYDVAGTGDEGTVVANQVDGTTTHHYSAPLVRDVSILVGDIRVVERSTAGVNVHLALPTHMATEADAFQDVVDTSVLALVDYLGPFPYDDLWVAMVPEQSEGVESTGALQMGDVSPSRDRWLFTHEIAHQWVYGLVGNNQARHPWMDEALVSMIQMVVDDPNRSPQLALDYPERARSRIGLAMADFVKFEDPDAAYVDAVYSAGADLLIEARDKAGHDVFDRTLRRYLALNAHRIATPEDFSAAFAEVPAVVEALRQVGAVP